MILDATTARHPSEFRATTQYALDPTGITWRVTGDFGAGETDEGLHRSRLLAASDTVTVGGVAMHLEAWEVALDEEDIQQAVHPDLREEFEKFYAAVGADGGMQTVEIEGREYVIVMSPNC